MTPHFHAVAFVDHQHAEVLQFGADADKPLTLHQHLSFTRQHGSGVRTEHVFFSEVCDALDGIAEVLLVGGHTGLSDFRRYVDQHRPQTAQHIVDQAVVDHPTTPQLMALARQRFARVDQMLGIPVPTRNHAKGSP
jgi:hypothetical protein